MKKVSNYMRLKRIIQEVIASLNLELTSMTVLSEVASGNFVVTPIIAAIAGAKKVYVVTKDSSYGLKDDVLDYLQELMDFLGIASDRICYVEDKLDIAEEVNIVTNLGFVRPIDKEFICRLPYDAAIPLMYESWELRNDDIDMKACREQGIPVLGTKETDSRLQIFRYVGMCAIKLLLESDVEIFKSRILLISSGAYLKEIQIVLESNGAVVNVYNPYESNVSREAIREYLKNCDAVVVAEQKNEEILVDNCSKHIEVEWLLESRPAIIHIAGLINYNLLEKYNIQKIPSKHIDYGYMTVTTDYVGIRPVIELHAAGLKVGQAMVDGLRKYRNFEDAQAYALTNSPAMELLYK